MTLLKDQSEFWRMSVLGLSENHGHAFMWWTCLWGGGEQRQKTAGVSGWGDVLSGSHGDQLQEDKQILQDAW